MGSDEVALDATALRERHEMARGQRVARSQRQSAPGTAIDDHEQRLPRTLVGRAIVDDFRTAGTLAIRHTLRQGSRELGEAKTSSSRRVLMLGETTKATLRRHRIEQRELMMRHRRRWLDLDFVFTTANGTRPEGRPTAAAAVP